MYKNIFFLFSSGQKPNIVVATFITKIKIDENKIQVLWNNMIITMFKPDVQ